MIDVKRRSLLASIAASVSSLAIQRTFSFGLPSQAGKPEPTPAAQSGGSHPQTQSRMPDHNTPSRFILVYQCRQPLQLFLPDQQQFHREKIFSQPMCGGVAAIDYNNDGLMDLFFTNGAKLPSWRRPRPPITTPAAQQRRRHV